MILLTNLLQLNYANKHGQINQVIKIKQIYCFKRNIFQKSVWVSSHHVVLI